ncbi:uncharacterized protein [Gossypium hirsutum]|uniref:Integrase catalytic domain-containing protein n=1 Tax=Gossypium hirsutum TaxID=3635 RepID=A0ABM3AMM0_GOSHI|nr:uncharacterized protein LOC121220730 [Gossypium hirsutum]
MATTRYEIEKFNDVTDFNLWNAGTLAFDLEIEKTARANRKETKLRKKQSAVVGTQSNLPPEIEVDDEADLYDDTTAHLDAVGNFPRPPQRQYNPYANTYNPGWRDHPNLSYGANPRNNQPYQNRFPQQSQGSGNFLETMVNKLAANVLNFQQQTLNFQKETKDFQQKIEVSIRELTSSIEKLTSQGKLPSQTEPNPRQNANAVMLRSGKNDSTNIEEVKRTRKFLKHLGMSRSIFRCWTPSSKYHGNERVNVDENVYAVLQRKMPANAKIGACVIIQLADRSVVHPEGVLEDVLVKVNELIFPANFYVIKMEEDITPGSSDLLLGRPLLTTASTKIDVRSGTLTMEFDREIVKFNVYDAISHPNKILSVNRIDIIDYLVEENYESIYGDDSELDEIEFVNELLSPNTKLLPSVIHAPELELKPLPKHLKYAFLGKGNTLLVIISNRLSTHEEESLVHILKSHKEAIGWTIADLKGISPLTCTHRIYLEEDTKPRREAQRRLNPNMMEVVKKEIIKLLDADVIYPISDSRWVSSAQVVPKKTGVTVKKNAEGHVVSSKGIEVDKAKIDIINSLHYPSTVRESRSFLGHAGFYRRFIKNFSKVAELLCELLQKDKKFEFGPKCKEAFDTLKQKLVSAPIVQPPDWKYPFEIMCDASERSVGAVLGQMIDKEPHVICYASKTLDAAQSNYTTTKKELLAVLSGCGNLVADHLSRIKVPFDDIPIKEKFPDESLFSTEVRLPWYADIVNFLATGSLPTELARSVRDKLRGNARYYIWDDPYLWKHCSDQIIRRCVPETEVTSILNFCHAEACGGHFGPKRTAHKVLECGLYWPTIFRDAYNFCKSCDRCQHAVDYVSKWIEAKPTHNDNAKTAMEFLKQTIFSKFGTPRALISDRGTHFCNKVMEALLAKYGVHHRIATAYHPQRNGQAEVSNREIKTILEKTVRPNRKDWSLRLNDTSDLMI